MQSIALLHTYMYYIHSNIHISPMDSHTILTPTYLYTLNTKAQNYDTLIPLQHIYHTHTHKGINIHGYKYTLSHLHTTLRATYLYTLMHSITYILMHICMHVTLTHKHS